MRRRTAFPVRHDLGWEVPAELIGSSQIQLQQVSCSLAPIPDDEWLQVALALSFRNFQERLLLTPRQSRKVRRSQRIDQGVVRRAGLPCTSSASMV